MIKSSAVANRKSKMATIRNRNGKLYMDYRANGKRVQRSTGLSDTPVNRKLLLESVIPKLEQSIKLGIVSKLEPKKFSHYFSKYVEIKQNDKGYHHKSYVYKLVNEHFGTFVIEKINRLHVKEYLNGLNIKNSSKKLYLATIRGVLDLAMDDDALERNVAKDIKLQKDDKEKVRPFSQEEVQRLLQNAEGMLKQYLGIAFYTGMRSGEILGLMRMDIADDHISIRRSISNGKVTSPKTLGSVRDIPLFENVRPYVDAQMNASKSCYLFELNGKPLRDISYFKRQWYALIHKCGIDYRKLYNTRHTFVTAMLNSGKYKTMDIARIVGHTSPRMILTTYSGFIGEDHLDIDTKSFSYGDTLVTDDSKKTKDTNMKNA